MDNNNLISLHYSTKKLNKPRQTINFAKIAPLIFMGVSTLSHNVTFAITPTQQAVADYFTDNSVCTTSGGYGGGMGYGGAAESVPSGNIKNIAGAGSVGTQAVLNGGSYDCSSLSSGGANLFQTGIETMLNTGTTLQTNALLQALAFEEVITMGTLNIEVNGIQMNNLAVHVAGLHQGGVGMRYPSLPAKKLKQAGKQTGGAGSASSKHGIGFFINTKVATGEKDNTSIETGFDYDAYGITGGMDIRLNDMFVLGLAAGYGQTEADYTSSTGSMDMDAYSLSVFGTVYKKDQYYIDGIINLTRNSFDSSRTFTDPNATTQTALGDTNGDVLNIGLAIGYEHNDKNLTIGPFAKLNYTRADIDAFSETGAGPWGLSVADQEITSFEGIVGIQMSKAISRPWGVLIPQMRLELVHEFDNESRIINAQFLGAVQNGLNNIMFQPTDAPDRTYFNLALSAAGQFSQGRSAYVQYTGLIGHDTVNEHAIELGVRWNY